jgi:GLPGLI family protein
MFSLYSSIFSSLKKQVFLLFFFISSISVFSQDIVCIYKVKVDSTHLKEKKLNLNEIYYNYINYLGDLSYFLKINNNESIYEINPDFKKKLDERSIKLVQSVGGRGVYYCNKAEDILLNQKEFVGEIYLIEQEKPVWILTNESKDIDGILCLKAYCIKKISNGKRQFDKTTIAWYAPSIPYSFGPKNFNGLPGLILELQENEVILYLEKIEFLKSNLKINVPDKGIKMSESQYEKFLNENGESFLKNNILKNLKN